MLDDRSSLAVDGGFSTPVFDAQSVFSKVLRAISRPGEIVDLGDCCGPPEPLSVAQGAILLALTDGDTPVFCEAPSRDCAAWLGFHTGARMVQAAEASFAVVMCFDLGCLERLPLGTLTYPDRSATVLMEVAGLDEGARFTIEGPGIDGAREIAVAGPGDGFIETRRANKALYPCGLDLILTSGTKLLALPRSTDVREV